MSLIKVNWNLTLGIESSHFCVTWTMPLLSIVIVVHTQTWPSEKGRHKYESSLITLIYFTTQYEFHVIYPIELFIAVQEKCFKLLSLVCPSTTCISFAPQLAYNPYWQIMCGWHYIDQAINALIARTNVKLLALSYTLFRLDHDETSGITKILYVS